MRVLDTKLLIPPLGKARVERVRLNHKLDEAHIQGGLTVVSAPAGSGKTTLVGLWAHQQQKQNRVGWLSLDRHDNSLASFLTCTIAALQKPFDGFGMALLHTLQSPQLPALEALMGALVHELLNLPDPVTLILDDFHTLDDPEVMQAMQFVLDHLPEHLHLLIVTREDPALPLARLRVKGKLTELRLADLRFTAQESTAFLKDSMGLSLSESDIQALDARTEGWIAGLQLAALSLQGVSDPEPFIQSFSGSHRFVLDYLMEEVWQQQTLQVQHFLLQTAVLDRMCASLCAALTGHPEQEAQGLLEALERANLFVVPLDHQRGWYRYHHLFADLLRQRLTHKAAQAGIPLLLQNHQKASQWYETHQMGMEAFGHAVAAQDLDRTERLLQSPLIPLHLRTTVDRVLDWMEKLPIEVLHSRPILCMMLASFKLIRGQARGVPEALQVAEQAFQHQNVAGLDDLQGQLHAMRSTLALTQYRLSEVLEHAGKALELLDVGTSAYRSAALWTQASALLLQGNRIQATRSYEASLHLSRQQNNTFSMLLALSGVGQLQELNFDFEKADVFYQEAIELAGDPPLPSATDAFLGLARMALERHELDQAFKLGLQSLQLALQYDPNVDRFLVSEFLLARIETVQEKFQAAHARLNRLEPLVHQRFPHRLPDLWFARLEVFLHQGNRAQAEKCLPNVTHPLALVWWSLFEKQWHQALQHIEPLMSHFEAHHWQEERLRLMCLKAVALHGTGETIAALPLVREVLERVAPCGAVHIFLDAGPDLFELLQKLQPEVSGLSKQHLENLLQKSRTQFQAAFPKDPDTEALTRRELEILHLIARGFSNQQIGAELGLALDTVKGHNRNIFGKLQVQRRTEALVRARELGLL